jgi:thiamine-monophosphate kinase
VPDISVSDEGELALIRRINRRLRATSGTPDLPLGPGDDAAVVAAPDGRVVATTDVMVEGRHFRRVWSSGYDVGRKSAASNLADVVAMGARPTAILVGLAAPGELGLDWVDGLADGLRDECALVGAVVAGGDIVASDTLTIAVTALGDLEGRPPVTRSGARPGDRVVLTGWPGRAAAGLALLRAGHTEHPLADAHRRPQPEYAAALVLAGHDHATAMIDTSDGLLADLTHVATASRVRIVLTASRLPVDPALAVAAELLGVDPFDWVAGGGDDHCFAATVPSDVDPDLPWIGGVVEVEPGGQPGVVFSDRERPALAGHEHFRS